MAQGDNWIDCTKQIPTDAIIRQLIYDDGAGNPVLHTNPEGTSLEPYFNCSARQQLTTEQVLRDMILEDADGKPYLNTTT